MSLRLRVLMLAALPLPLILLLITSAVQPQLAVRADAERELELIQGLDAASKVSWAAIRERQRQLAGDADTVRAAAAATDIALAQYAQWLTQAQDLGDLHGLFDGFRDLAEQAATTRGTLPQRPTIAAVLAVYGPTVDAAPTLYDRAATVVNDPEISAMLRAQGALSRARSADGMAMALIERAAAADRMDPALARLLARAVGDAENQLELFHAFRWVSEAQDVLAEAMEDAEDQGRGTLLASVAAQTVSVDLATRLNREFGYGGFIHAFKNFVLRGQPRHARRAAERGRRLLALLDGEDARAVLPDAQRQTLIDTVNAYLLALDDVRSGYATGLAPAQIDDNVRIDDGPALAALATLVGWQPPLEAGVRQRMATDLAGGMRAASGVLRTAMQARAETLAKQADRIVFWLLGTIIALALAVLVIAVTGYRRLSSGLTGFQADLERIVETGDVATDVQPTGDDEISALQRLIQQYNRRMREMAGIARRMADGDIEVQPQPLGEGDLLAHALVDLNESARSVVLQADQIARGDYAVTVRTRGEDDRLAQALRNMSQALVEYRQTVDDADWAVDGQLQVLRALRNPRTVEDAAQAVLRALVRRTEADIGAVWLLEDDALVLGAQVGLADDAADNTRLDRQHGQLGRALAADGARLLTDLPAGYLQVATGTGAGDVSAVALTGLRAQGRPVGALELAWLHPPGERVVALLDAVDESIALAIDAVRAKQDTERLLEETRAQSTKLEEQQEELRVSNEELEEQTQALRQSEEELKMQREELRTTNEELEEKSEVLSAERAKLEATAVDLRRATQYKSEFLANMSHELRTPLNSMLILSKQLADNEDGNLTAEQAEAAGIVHDSGRDLLELINEILDLSKVEAGQLELHVESVALAEVFAALERQFKPLADRRGIGLRFERDALAPEALATDRQRLQQVIRNLLSNAIKFTHAGEVTLRAGPPGPDMPRPLDDNDQPLADADLVALSVIDTGIGIPADRLDEIFQPFVQADGSTSRQYGGTGLGLSICREMARLLGGLMHASSAPGQGSTFTVIVRTTLDPSLVPTGHAEPAQPAVESPAATAPAPTLPTEAAEPQIPDDREAVSGAGDAILIVEDDPRFATVVRDQVRRRGRKAVVALTGNDGLALAGRLNPAGIILDLNLPDMDGKHVLTLLKSNLQTRHIPVHVVSASDPNTETLSLGAVGFLAKPASADDLAGVLAQIEATHSARRRVLVVEDDPGAQTAIRSLLANDQTEIESETHGEVALARMAEEHFDCVVLDLKLPDIDGFEFLRRLKAREADAHPPVVVYTGRDLTRDEHRELSALAQSVVVKGAESPERLLDEVTLFVHALNEQLPDAQRQVLARLHDGSDVFAGRKLLVVDDDLRNTFALSATLKKRGFEVLIADNGELALAKLDEHPDVDIVLMDIMMPVMDGYEAMQRIRANPRLADMPVIALTAKAMAEDRRKCIEAGASDYMSKPVDVDRLLAMIRVWLGRAR